MARRKEEARGPLVYQEGKNIEGEYYVVAVFDDADTCTIGFSAYELENDCTYTYPVTYEEFDDFFRHNTELVNPSNMDARFHWVVERLDFVTDHRGEKVLCLADEPTPEAVEEEPADEASPGRTLAGTEEKLATTAHGMLDAETRARLLRELDCQNFTHIQRGLVRSEAGRKKFLVELFNKRQLEQLKANQRLQKLDAERVARLSKFADSRRNHQEKSQQARATEEATRSTMMQLEVLKKQKQAADIRKLLASRGTDGGNEKRAESRQLKRAQEKKERERLAIERQRDEQLARNREIQVQKYEDEIRNRNRSEAEKVRERREAERMIQVKRREDKDAALEEIWKLKGEARLEVEARRDEFERLEEIREGHITVKERTRAANERQNLLEHREREAAAKERAHERRCRLRDEALLRWRVDASKKAVAARDNKRRTANRITRLQEKEDLRLRKFRESQFLETIRSSQMMGARLQDTAALGGGLAGGEPDTTQRPEELSYEQQERARRHAEAEEQRRKFELKKAKVDRLGANNPNIAEVIRFREWKKQEEQRQQQRESRRAEHELREATAKKADAAHAARREETFKALAPQRREASQERQRDRREAMVLRSQNVPIGTALPFTFVY